MRSSKMNKILLIAAVAAALFVQQIPVRASFEYTPIDIEIPFSVSEEDIDESVSYKVVIEPREENAPEPKETEKTINGSGKGTFEIVADEPGTYSYKIFERKGADENIQYDGTSYIVKVFVTSDDEGNLDYQIILSDGTSVKPKDVKFINKATDKPEDPSDPTDPTDPTDPSDPSKPTDPTGPTAKPTGKPDNPVAWTGETLSRYLPYALISIGLGIGIIIIVIIRRRRDKTS